MEVERRTETTTKG